MKLADAETWRERRVLVTGHTGFKGAWLCLRLRALGAKVTGLALDPPTTPSLYDLAGVAAEVDDRRGDLRDPIAVEAALEAARPEVVFHLAAQPLVRIGLEAPIETIEVNGMGSARLFEALRKRPPAAVVCVTSDKVYRNDAASGRAFAESSELGGGDPYSGSKAVTEMVARIWRESFGLPLVTARAGNVVGGGDFAADRLLPDVWRACSAGEALVLRRPDSTRPWSHVLDILEGYLLYAEAVLAARPGLPEALNFGPAPGAPAATAIEAAEAFAERLGQSLDWRLDPAPYPEKAMLAIDSSAARTHLGWSEAWPGLVGVRAAGDWCAAMARDEDPGALSRSLARREVALGAAA